VVAYPEDVGVHRLEAKRSLLAARSMEDLVAWSGGLYDHPHDSGAGNENGPLIQHDCQGSLVSFLNQGPAVRLAYVASQSLIAEAELTPKPGLVDRRGAGAHTDLSLSIMKLSAFAIHHTSARWLSFPKEVIQAGVTGTARGHWTRCGTRHAQGHDGSNSHKGAIWILGLLVSAAAFEVNDEVEASKLRQLRRRLLPLRTAPHLGWFHMVT